MLADLVKAGKLPPVEQRLPIEPFVIGPGILQSTKNLPNWQSGKYGGTLHEVHYTANWNADIFVMLNEPLLKAPDLTVQNVKGNIVQDFKVENNNQDFTFNMRKGLKWSDGQPVTSEDVRFTWEDIYGNDKLFPNGLPTLFRVGYSPGGAPGKLQIIDDYTFKISFPAPYGGFVRALTIEGWVGYTALVNPSHFLKKYHIKYTTLDQMKSDLQANKLTNEWWNLFSLKWCQNWDMTNTPKCAGYPTLSPWVPQKSDQGILKWTRNPYFYMVDTEGKQLPYIDEIISSQVGDVGMVNTQVANGNVDYLLRSAMVAVPMFKQAENKVNIKVTLLDTHVDSTGLALNETYSDTNWQKVSQDIRFRQAVSHAINRKEMIDTLYYGYASMPDVTVGPQNDTYDVALANKLLDDLGLKKGADGFRTYPDGKPVTIMINHQGQESDMEPAAELAVQYLSAVGIKASVKKLEPNTYNSDAAANKIQAFVAWSHDQGWDSDYTQGDASRAGQEWELWRSTQGKQGIEPPDWIKQAYQLDKKRWESVSGSDEYNQLKEQGYAWERANLPYINFVEHVKYPTVARKTLHNIASAGYAIANTFAAVQFWFDK